MKSKFVPYVIAALIPVFCRVAPVVAETDYVAMPVIHDIQKGVDNANQIQDLRVLDDATIGGDLTLSGGFTAANGDMTISNLTVKTISEVGTAGVAVEGVTLNDGDVTSANGVLTASNVTINGIITMINSEKIDNSSDGQVTVYSSTDDDMLLEVRSPKTTDGDASLRLVTDAGDDVTDFWKILNDADDANKLKIQNYSGGSYGEEMVITTNGAVSALSGFQINGVAGITTNLVVPLMPGSNVTFSISGGIITNVVTVP